MTKYFKNTDLISQYLLYNNKFYYFTENYVIEKIMLKIKQVKYCFTKYCNVIMLLKFNVFFFFHEINGHITVYNIVQFLNILVIIILKTNYF